MNDEIFAKLMDESTIFSLDESFELSRVCAEYLNTEDENKNEEARKIIIHVLDRWSSFPSETQSLWTDLVEAAGFYPYLYRHDNDMKLTSLSDEVRANSHLSSYLPVALHSDQKKLLKWLLDGKNMVVSAPTSFGKVYLLRSLSHQKSTET